MYGGNVGGYCLSILLSGPDWFAAVYIPFRSTDTLSVLGLSLAGADLP